jgi:hypothetical protein
MKDLKFLIMEEKNKGGRPSKKDEEKRTERAVCQNHKKRKKKTFGSWQKNVEFQNRNLSET